MASLASPTPGNCNARRPSPLTSLAPLQVGAREVEVSAAGRTAAAAAACGGWTEQLPDRLCLHEFHQDQARPAGVAGVVRGLKHQRRRQREKAEALLHAVAYIVLPARQACPPISQAASRAVRNPPAGHAPCKAPT